MSRKIGFIGCGKMAQAMIEGILAKGELKPEEIMVSAKTNATLTKVKEAFHVQTSLDNREVTRFADVLILAVKPNLHREIASQILDNITENQLIVTIAAGITLADLEEMFVRPRKFIRAMPNTPSLVGEGMTALCFHRSVNAVEQDEVRGIFTSFGKVDVFHESQMDSIPAISGSSPAYVYMFIEALADGGVKQGLAREQAYRMAAQAVLGAAKMVLETGKHPGELKDQVCTPGGATIEAVAKLEETGFRASVLAAMSACTEKIHILKKGENRHREKEAAR